MKINELIERASKGEFVAVITDEQLDKNPTTELISGKPAVVLADADGYHIAYTNPYMPNEEANAQLIAHALNNFMPMLEALILCQDYLSEIPDFPDLEHEHNMAKNVDSAIKNAKEVA